MNEFSSELARRTHDWLVNRERQQGWALTLIGNPGNGKSTFAATLLQMWRDHITPEVDGFKSIKGDLPDKRSQFITFETFKDNAGVRRVNEKTGWVDPPEIDGGYIDRLIEVGFLVLDDLCSKELRKVECDALYRLLRARYDVGRMTVITTNKTIPELGKLLGENVADRLREGVVLEFVDDSQRGKVKTRPQGHIHLIDGKRYMPNPAMDPDKAYIPYVEPAGEAKDDTAVTESIESKAESQAAGHSTETSEKQSLEDEEKALAAAIASMAPFPRSAGNATLVNPAVPAAAMPIAGAEPIVPPTEPVTASRVSMFPPPHHFGEWDDDDDDDDEAEAEQTFVA